MVPNIIHSKRELDALAARRAQLEDQAERCRAALREGDLPSPSIGRELDAVSSTLAQVRAQLARVANDARGTRPDDTER